MMTAAYPTFLDEDGALCASAVVDPEWFSAPGKAMSTRRKNIRRAQRVCAACPLVRRCGRWGMATGQTGVWGGMYLEGGRPFHAE